MSRGQPGTRRQGAAYAKEEDSPASGKTQEPFGMAESRSALGQEERKGRRPGLVPRGLAPTVRHVVLK